MHIASQDNIIRILSGYNQWWELGSVQKQFLKPSHRTIFNEALNLLTGNKVRTIIVTGPHRTGKTAMLHQLAQRLIDDGVNPKHIVYFNFSHPFFSFLPLADLYATYHDNINPDISKRVFCIFDEIQLSADWEKSLSTLCDTYDQITVIAAGAVKPENPVRDSVLLHMPPISFYEHCQIAMGTEKLDNGNIFPDSGILKASPLELKAISKHISQFRPFFMRYLYTGGFLNLIGETDDIRIQRMIQRSVVGDAILRDINISCGIRNTVELEKVFLYLCFECPGIISYEALLRTVDCASRPTIEKYVKCLDKAGLIYMCYPEDMDSERKQKVRPKIYLVDASIHNSLLMLNDVRINESGMNKIVETAVYRHLRFYGPDSTEGQITYSRAKSKGKKLDMILDGRKRLFIDVRYERDVKLSMKDDIIARSGEADICLIITQNDRMIGRVPGLPQNVFCLPANIFLYLIGQAKSEGRSFLDGI